MSDNCLVLGGGEEEKFQNLEDTGGGGGGGMEDELDAFNDETFGGFSICFATSALFHDARFFQVASLRSGRRVNIKNWLN